MVRKGGRIYIQREQKFLISFFIHSLIHSLWSCSQIFRQNILVSQSLRSELSGHVHTDIFQYHRHLTDQDLLWQNQ